MNRDSFGESPSSRAIMATAIAATNSTDHNRTDAIAARRCRSSQRTTGSRAIAMMIETTITITKCHSWNHAHTSAAATSTFAIARHDTSNRLRRSVVISRFARCAERRRYARRPFRTAYWSSAATPSSTVAVITPTPTERPTTAETN